MTVRPFRESDAPMLQAMAEASGFPYPDPSDPLIEGIIVVADDLGRPLMACAAKRILELYLFCGEFDRPHAKLHALRMLHEAMPEVLKSKGYSEVNAFIPPECPLGFKRKLLKLFGWVPNWPSIARRF